MERQIGIFDNHDGCEWVNVSSGTSSPRLSRTKSTCVCVCISHSKNYTLCSCTWYDRRRTYVSTAMHSVSNSCNSVCYMLAKNLF